MRFWRGGARPHKFAAITKTKLDGLTFDSKKEARRYQQLKLLRDAGAITALDVHPRFPIVLPGLGPVKIRSEGFPNGRAVEYEADFRYTITSTGEQVVEDVKGLPTRRSRPAVPGEKPKRRSMGTDTDVARLKRALVEAIYGIRVRVI